MDQTCCLFLPPGQQSTHLLHQSSSRKRATASGLRSGSWGPSSCCPSCFITLKVQKSQMNRESHLPYHNSQPKPRRMRRTPHPRPLPSIPAFTGRMHLVSHSTFRLHLQLLTLGTLRSLAPARAAARPEMGRSSAGENRPAGRGGAGGGGGAPGGGAGPDGEMRGPPALSVGGSGGGGGGGGWPAAEVGLAGVEVRVEEGGRGGGGGGAGVVDPGVGAMSGM